ncbi:MAG TPA: hypothetical protein VFQ42_18965, partial [Mycobacterium sp.]|nr:hypothetical protein [Mycobacterium sp.]
MADDLLGEVRIALRLSANGVRECEFVSSLERLLQHRFKHRLDVFVREPPQLDAGIAPLLAQPGEYLVQVMVVGQLVVPVGAHHEHARVGQL